MDDTQELNDRSWSMGDATILGLVFVGALIVGELIVPNASHIHFWSSASYFQRSQLRLLLVLALQFAAIGSAMVAFCVFRGLGEPLSSIDWNMNWHIGSCILFGLVLAVVVSIESILVFRRIPKFPGGTSAVSILLFLLTTALIQPFLEECFFRGILFQALARRSSKWVTIAITSVLFGLYHVGGYHNIHVFVAVGVVLAFVRIRTKSVAACFGLHLGYNVGILIAGLC